MVNPKRINTIPKAIEEYQKKHPYLKRYVFEKYYVECQTLNKQLLRHPATGFVFDSRTKLLVGKCALGKCTDDIIDLTPDEWHTVFERLVLAQYLYKNPIYKRKVFNLFQKRVEIIQRHERLDFYIHQPTQIVFDCKTKKAVGRLLGNDTVEDVDPNVVLETFGPTALCHVFQ